MRTYEEYRRILILWEEGHNKMDIARQTGIPRGTVTDCIKRYVSVAALERLNNEGELGKFAKASPEPILKRIREKDHVREAYAYLFGLYLGDGCITKPKSHRVYLLRVALDLKYPGIIQSCKDALTVVMPDNKVNDVEAIGCTKVTCYSKHWPHIFPQDGKGPKHLREIKLEPWQQSIVDEYPLEFFRGLYHSDGTRSRNIVNGKDYPRYTFCNTSVDILKLFSDTCDKLGLHWTTKSEKRSMAANLIFISKRKDVAYLDEVVGPKS